MKTTLKILAGLILLMTLIYLLGPRAEFKEFDNRPLAIEYPIEKLDAMIKHREEQYPGIKEDNASQFIWKDSFSRTDYSFVYLHGFSASHGECQPILKNLADRYQANTYLPRLHQHGLNDVDAFKDLEPAQLVDSAKEAIAIGKSIGRNLIVISTSTGSTLASYLAANDPDIKALVCLSPNFDLYDSKSQLLVKPWGKQFFRFMMGGDYRQWETSPEAMQYWTTKNHIDAHIALRHLLNETMTEATFKSIDVPVYITYYYKNDSDKDEIISIEAIQHYADHLSTAADSLEVQAISHGKGHVIASKYMNEEWAVVQDSIFQYLNKIMGI